MTLEEQKTRIIEEIETTLFYNKFLNNTIFDCIEELETIDFEEFKNNLSIKIDFDYNDNLKWAIIKEYATIEDLKTIDFKQVETKFFEDLKNCFNIVLVINGSRPFEEIATRFINAIKTIANKQNNLDNLQSYLSMHFEIWLNKFAQTPTDITNEIEHFSNMEI